MHHTKIAMLRKSWALTQDELARLLGMTRSNVSRLEQAPKSQNLETALLLQALFGESVSTIFPSHDRAAHETLAARLADFSTAIDEEGAVAERKRELLSEFASRASVADFAL